MMSPVTTAEGTSRVAQEQLTKREHQVLLLIAEGLTTKEISEQLNISFKTAACHRFRIMSKFDVHNSVTLIRAAIKGGIIEP